MMFPITIIGTGEYRDSGVQTAIPLQPFFPLSSLKREVKWSEKMKYIFKYLLQADGKANQRRGRG